MNERGKSVKLGPFFLDPSPYDWRTAREYLVTHDFVFSKSQKTKRKKAVTYYNMPSAFDIETSTFYLDENGNQVTNQERNQMSEEERDKLTPRACLVCWQFGIDGRVFFGRTWEEFQEFCNILHDCLKLSEELELIVYVHNLAYEFQWFHQYIEWSEVFATDMRKPVNALTKQGIRFKDSYILTNLSLNDVGEKELHTYKVEKKTGDWDYSLIRSTSTPLTDKEIGYAIYDVLVVMALIREKIEEEGAINKIPLTKTGYARRFCKKKTIDSKTYEAQQYKKLVQGLKVEQWEYNQLKQTFMGGFTHSNATYWGDTIEGVRSYDETSAYPAQMVMEQFPMGKASEIEPTSREELEEQCELYCCMWELTLYNVESKIPQENIISESKCINVVNAVTNNGRIFSADELTICVTEVDWYNIKDTYNFNDEIGIANFVRYFKGYLPTLFVKAILYVYSQKTKLKGIDSKAVEYTLIKALLNSLYGMIVTDIIREEAIFKGNWTVNKLDDGIIGKQLSDYNSTSKRFLYYPWGVWVTAYARRALICAIIAAGDNYVYSDTDSIKFVRENSEHIEKYVEEYNNEVRKKMRAACDYHKIPYDLVEPESNDGTRYLLGSFDLDGDYDRFKTLGAKRYCWETKKKGFNVTVAGAVTVDTIKYIKDQAQQQGCSPFDLFNDSLQIPLGKSGKKLHHYIDSEFSGHAYDYLGNRFEYHEKSAVAIGDTSFKMGLSDSFFDFLIVNGLYK